MTAPKDWIQTASGRQFWPLAPRVDDVCIEDIAHALAMKCRYAGHTSRFYSVAEHSVFVSRFAAARAPHGDKIAIGLWGLLHDAGEAYLPDVPRPIKASLVGFQEIERRVMGAVADRFGLEWPEPRIVKDVDDAILGDEVAAFMSPVAAPWSLPAPRLGITLPGWPQDEARREFLKAYYRLQHGDAP